MPTPYAVEWTDAAIESRRALTDKRQVVVLDIVQQLAAEARNSHGEPGEGRSRVYRDPATMISVTYECDAQNHVIRIVHAAQPQVPVPPQLFISYSHKDKKWLEDLRKYLDFLEEQQLVRQSHPLLAARPVMAGSVPKIESLWRVELEGRVRRYVDTLRAQH